MDHLTFAQLLGNYGEFVGAIAVILTLGYLAVQIRQNTNQIRNQGPVDVNESYSALTSQLLADDELYQIVIKGCQDWGSITPLEQSRFHLFFLQNLNHWRMAYQLNQKRALDSDVYRSIENLHIRVLDNPGCRQWWSQVGESFFESSFANSVNHQLRSIEGEGKSTSETISFFRPDVPQSTK